jgi:hypothetical protein
MEAELMRVLQFAKRSVVTVALVSVTLAGCGGESFTDAPFNPAGTSADMEAMNSTFGSPTFASFSTFSLLFDAALGGPPLISASAAALDIPGKSLARAERAGGTAAIRAAALRTAQRMAAIMPRPAAKSKAPAKGFSASAMALPTEVAGKTFVYDPGTAAYVVSDLPLLATNTVRFTLYAVDPVTFAPIVPLVETGHVDVIDLSAGSTHAARVLVISGGTTYVDYTVSASSTASSARISVIGYVTDGATQANINLRSTISFTAGLMLTYSLDLPQRDVSIDLTVNVDDVSTPDGTMVMNLLMRGPNGTVAMTGTFTSTTGTINVRINGHAFATITTDGTTTTIIRNDGLPLADDELEALTTVFEMSGSAFTAFDQMFAPVGTLFQEPV